MALTTIDGTFNLESTGSQSLCGEVYGRDEADLIYGSHATSAANYCVGKMEFLVGGDGDDDIYGNGGDDWILGEFGDDTLYGGPGNDLLVGGDGMDTLKGGFNDDKLHGGGGTDTLLGENGNDVLYGGLGTDTMGGGAGDDFLCDTSYPAGLSCPGVQTFQGFTGTNKAWMEKYFVHGSQSCNFNQPTGDATVDVARDDDWQWESSVLRATGFEENNDSAWSQCASLIADLGR